MTWGETCGHNLSPRLGWQFNLGPRLGWPLCVLARRLRLSEWNEAAQGFLMQTSLFKALSLSPSLSLSLSLSLALALFVQVWGTYQPQEMPTFKGQHTGQRAAFKQECRSSNRKSRGEVVEEQALSQPSLHVVSGLLCAAWP